MKFTAHKFSKRFPPLECALFVVHEPVFGGGPYTTVPACTETPYRGTAAAIILPDGRFWIGVTLCSPSDQFVRATGRNKATGRAFQRIFHRKLSMGSIALPFGNEWSRVLSEQLRGAINSMKAEKGETL